METFNGTNMENPCHLNDIPKIIFTFYHSWKITQGYHGKVMKQMFSNGDRMADENIILECSKIWADYEFGHYTSQYTGDCNNPIGESRS